MNGNRLTTAAPKCHVLSFRVNDREWRRLRDVSLERGLDVSSLLRQSLDQLLKDR